VVAAEHLLGFVYQPLGLANAVAKTSLACLDLGRLPQSSNSRPFRSGHISDAPSFKATFHNCLRVTHRSRHEPAIITGHVIFVDAGEVQSIAAAGRAGKFNQILGQVLTIPDVTLF
jgi:hypothetical protein